MAGEKILVVEDEGIVALDLQRTLERMGYVVPAVAASGAEALRQAQEHQPDLALMDIVLQGEMDGIEAARQIRQRMNIPVIYLTAYANDQKLERAKLTEPIGYILKPYEETELRATVEMALYQYQHGYRRLAQRLEGLMEALPDGVVVVDGQGRIEMANSRLEEMFGYSRDELIGQAEEILLPESARAVHVGHRTAYAADPRVRPMGLDLDLYGQRKDGIVFPVDVSLSPMQTDGGTFISGTIRDITQHKQREREQAAVVALATALRTASTRAEMLPVILNQLADLLQAEGAAAALFDPASGDVVAALATGAWAAWTGQRLPPGTGITGQVIADGQPYVNDDVRTDPDFTRPDLLLGLHAVACVPLMAQGQTIGTLWIGRRTPIAAHEVELLTTIADMAANALQRAIALETLEQRVAERTRELDLLATVAQAANRHTEIGPLLDQVLSVLAQAVDAQAAWLLLLDEQGRTPLAAAHNLPPALEAGNRAAMRWPGCTCQRRLLAGELSAAQNIVECERLQRAKGDRQGLRFHVSVPLRAADRTLGLFNLAFSDRPLFADGELRLLSTASDQLAVAIERARLYEQVKAQRVEEQTVLLELSQALLAESAEQAMLDRAARVAVQALRVELASIVLVDEDGQTVSRRAGIGWPEPFHRQMQRIPLTANYSVNYAIHSRQSVIMSDRAQETRFEVPPFVVEMGIASSLIVPMFAEGRAIGGLIVNSRTPREWSDDEVRLLSLIANTTAQALERARLFATVQRSEERYRAVSELISDYAYAFRVEPGNVLVREWVTKAFVRITSFTSEEIEEMDERGGWPSLIHPEDMPIALRRAERLFAGQPDVSEFRIVTKSGEVRWLRDYGRPEWDEAECRVVRIYGAAQDITERKQRKRELEAIATVAAALREAETRAAMLPVVLDQLANVLRTEGAAIVLLDPATGEEVVELATGAWTEGGGMRLAPGADISGEVIARRQPYVNDDLRTDPRVGNIDLFAEVHAAACVPLITQDQAIGALWMGRRRAIDPDDVRILTAIADIAANALYRAQVLETLEQRVAERTRELAAANERLQELDRLKSKFVSDVSHELRTPITNLKLYLSLLDMGRPEKRQQYLDVLKAESGRLAQLVEDILDLSRLELGRTRIEFGPVDLNAVIQQVIVAHQPQADAAGLELTFTADPNLPSVWGERNQLAQVVTNLVANAINYTSAGHVRVSTRLAEEEACLYVEDSGIGIPGQDLPYLFERFYRGQNVSQSNIPGSGLGLGILKEIVDLHGGRIQVESEVGVGSTFRVWLPVHRG